MAMRNLIRLANIVTAFEHATIGTKVTDPVLFWRLTDAAIDEHDFQGGDTPGQASIVLPTEALNAVSGGAGPRSEYIEDYIVRTYRGSDSLFLRRERASQPTEVKVIVYTRGAYLDDPDVKQDDAERCRIARTDADFVLVAVIASAAPRAPLGIERLTRNLAGGNKDALVWSGDDIRSKVAESLAYHKRWATVADPDETSATAHFDAAWFATVRIVTFLEALIRPEAAAMTGDQIRGSAKGFVARLDATD